MMKKRKIALALGLCTVVGLSAVGLAACGEKPPKEGAKSEYYIVGFSASDIFGGELDWGKQHKETVAEIPDAVNFKTTKTSNVYELTVDLYENDEFQIVIAGKGWTGQMGYEVLAKDHPANGVVEIPGGGTNSNFKLDRDGRYTFTLTVNGEGASTVTYTRTDEQAKLPRISLDKTALVVKMEADATLVATRKDTEEAVTWSSDHPEIASVDANGKVTGKVTGVATITAKCGELTAQCKVTVSNVAVNYYICGTMTNWTPSQTLDGIEEEHLFTESGVDVYSLTTNLYAGDKLQVLTLGAGNYGWEGALGYFNLDDETKALASIGADNANIKIKDDGNYKITITQTDVPAEGSVPAYVKKEIHIERKGDAPALEVEPWTYDVYAKGSWNWNGDLKKVGTTSVSNETTTVTGDITLDAGVNFGFVLSATTGEPAQVGNAWGGFSDFEAAANSGVVINVMDENAHITFADNNAKVLKAGTYNVTVKLNGAGNGFVTIIFNSFTAAA